MTSGAGRPVALWAIPVSDLGGVARHVLDVGGHGLPGWDLVVLCPPGPLAELLVEAGIEVVPGAFGPAAGTAASVRTLAAVVRERSPSVVHSHLAHADVVAAIVGAGRAGGRGGGRAGVLVSTEHGIAADDAVYHGSPLKAKVMAGVHRVRQRRLDGLIAVSFATLATVQDKWGLPGSLTTEVIPNGIDRPASPPVRSPGLHIGSVSRLAPEKRLGSLIDAFASLADEHPEARLTIAGTGPLRDELGARAVATGFGDRVDFPGHVDTAEIFERLDVVVLPSVFENCSYTLLEAAAAGCGVVATDVGGNAEILPVDALVLLDDTPALTAAIVRQGLDVSTRPGLDPAWPSVAEMCDRIVAFYERLDAEPSPEPTDETVQ